MPSSKAPSHAATLVLLLAFAPGPVLAQPAPAEAEQKANAAQVAERKAAEAAPAPAPAPATAKQSVPAEPVSRAELDAALARLRHEPSIARVLDAALRSEPPDVTAELASRARLSGLLPTLGLKARRGQAVDLTATDVASGDGLRVGTDDDLTLEAALRFELDKLLFAREEVPLARETRSAHEARESRAQQVIAVYFERRRLRLEAELAQRGRLPTPKGDKPGDARLERELRIAELTALLDTFTGGAFSRMMESARPHPR